jgi:hypothetical protein
MDGITFCDLLEFAGYVVGVFSISFFVAVIAGCFIRFGSGE